MTNILNNKAFRAFMAVALTVLLAVTLIPNIQPAYGTNDGAQAAPTEDASDAIFDESVEDEAAPGDAETPETPDASDMPDASGMPEGEGAEAEGDHASEELDPESDAAVSGDSSQGAEGISADEIAPQSEGEPDAQAKTDEVTQGGQQENVTGTILKGKTITGTFTYDDGAHTLVVNGTFKGKIIVTAGATLTIEGKGTIQSNGAGSIIHVEGGDSKLVFDGPTVQGARSGTLINHHAVFVTDETFQAGGGILVERGADGSTAALHFKSGTVENNKAQVGGGIFIDRNCGFTMTAGTIQGNTATKHEGGGIYLAGHQSYTMKSKARLNGGSILNNRTKTTTDWGGGGIFIESEGELKIASALITDNHALGLGGGISGCPHAVIGIGKITDGAAIYGNTAEKEKRPDNSALYDNNGVGDHVAYDKDDAGFTKEKAQDFYCTLGSVVYGQDTFETGSSLAWTGRKADANGNGADVTIARGQYYAVEKASLGLTAKVPKSPVTGRKVTIKGNESTTHGGGIGCNGKLSIGDLPTGEEWGTFSFSFKKELQNSMGEGMPLDGRKFSFALYANKDGSPIATAENDESGTVRFTLGRSYYESIGNNRSRILTFYLKETGAYDGITTDSQWYTVKIKIKKQVTTGYVSSTFITFYTPVVEEIKIDNTVITDEKPFTVINVFDLKGQWAPEAKKFFHGGQGESGAYRFELVEIEDPKGSLEGAQTKGEPIATTNGGFTEDDGSAKVTFGDISYTEPGEHWYRIRETNGNDPVVYVVKVVVAGNDKPSTALVASVAELFYADSLDGSLKPLDVSDPIEFHNNAGEEAYALSGYAVNALSGAPLTQKCLVDPKIIKELEGRTITPGEFSFQLIEVADYADTTGEVISETTNDADGMVDFDAAANKADPGWEPSCLLFTQPGTYKYRVIEDPKQLADPSVDYSTQVITFTVTVELNPDTGVLAATDMYYGYLNEAGENVRYKEQYTNWEEKEKDPTWVPSIADYPDYDPKWHPTMTNRAKPQDLVVKKSSALTGEALEGATYALYLVNHGGEADLRLANGTSDADGLIYFEDVSLKVGNLYYFMEEAAPAGHTVSKFRSKYFYLVPDASVGNGYAMRYTDNKFVMEEASDELVSAHELDESYGGNEADPLPTTEPTVGKDGALLYAYEADGGVQDEATYVEFNKLDTRTHEWVEGAKLSIVEKETGQVVNAWTSGKAPEVLQKALNVDVVYVLREDEAPEGYERAADVEFRIDSYGAVEILSGTENGNAELAGSTITLYDTRLPIEETVTETRETTREVPRDRTLSLAKTGDALPLLAMGLIALGALVALVLAARRTRKGKHSSR